MYTIGVTGVGGGVGQSILKALKDSEYKIIAMDGEPLAAGLYASQYSYLIPYANSPEFVPRLLDICKMEKIDILFPGLDAELMPLALHRDSFEAIDTAVVVSSPEVIAISDNKQYTYDQLMATGVNVPMTTGLDSIDIHEFPLIIKQKNGGARSKNVYLIKSKEQLDALLQNLEGRLDDFIAQQFIDGPEYTCGTVNLDGNCKGVIVMRRILRDGDTHKCFVEANNVIEEAVRSVVNNIKPFGACNVQLRTKDGVPYVFEINARCSGTTASRALCGFNEPLMIADYILKNISPVYEIQQRAILRYWNELVVDNNVIEELKRNKTLIQAEFETL